MTTEDPMAPEPFTDGIRPRWYPRARQEKIRRLYEADAQGMLDEELVEDVGMTLYQRCRSILTATEAHEGCATCPRCGGKMPHHWDKDEILTCPGCGWQTTWGAYFGTYRDKQLHGGGAVFAFQQYVEQYPQAQSARERWLLIDWLIHAFHWELQEHYSRPAACNLIEGKLHEVTQFLDSLSYGERSTPAARERLQAWRCKVTRAEESWRAARETKARQRGRLHEGD